MAKLYFKYGAMNSGKSMFLLATAFNFKERGIPFLCLKPSVDTRDGYGKIHSRALGDGDCYMFDRNVNLVEYVKNLLICELDPNADHRKVWILVDEAQFLTSEQVDNLAVIVDTFNLNVMCYGLRTDFRTKLFEGSKRLFEIADTIEEIKSMCDCGKKNIVNARIDDNGNVVLDGNQIMVGGNDRYTSMCRTCFAKKISEYLMK